MKVASTVVFIVACKGDAKQQQPAPGSGSTVVVAADAAGAAAVDAAVAIEIDAAEAKVVTDEDKKLVETWFEKVRLGDGPKGIDGSPWENYATDDQSKFTYSDTKPQQRAITVKGLYHAVGAGKFDGSASVTLIFDDKNQLVDIR